MPGKSRCVSSNVSCRAPRNSPARRRDIGWRRSTSRCGRCLSTCCVSFKRGHRFMHVGDLQRFVHNQAELLSQAGAKSVATDLERLAAGLAPFASLTVAQLADFLVRAESYERTGVLPASGKSPRIKAPAPDSAQKVRDAAQ